MSSSHAETVAPAPAPARRGEEPASGDQLLTISGVNWEAYEAIGAALGDGSSVRLTYVEGTLELMSPSKAHEWVKGTVGRLIEVFAEEMGIDVSSYGSATFRAKAKARGVEPDECYFRDEQQELPDLAIEVIFTSGAVDKLDVYAGVGVREVWLWKDGRITVYWLRSGRYEQKRKSKLLPGIDLAELEELLRSGTQSHAVRTYRARLRKRRAPEQGTDPSASPAKKPPTACPNPRARPAKS